MGKGKDAQNYYDILNVRSDCSDKEIKLAYIQLSKKFHPDVKSVKTDLQQTSRFLKITEAYQTLSKPKLRIEYDRSLLNSYATTVKENAFPRPWEIKLEYETNPGPYYGIKGVRKVSNSKVALFVIVLGICSGVFGITSIKQSFTLNQKALDDISAKATEHHQKIRSEVRKHTKDEQLQRVIERMEIGEKR